MLYLILFIGLIFIAPITLIELKLTACPFVSFGRIYITASLFRLFLRALMSIMSTKPVSMYNHSYRYMTR